MAMETFININGIKKEIETEFDDDDSSSKVKIKYEIDEDPSDDDKTKYEIEDLEIKSEITIKDEIIQEESSLDSTYLNSVKIEVSDCDIKHNIINDEPDIDDDDNNEDNFQDIPHFNDEDPPEIIKHGNVVMEDALLENLLKKFYTFDCKLCNNEKTIFENLSKLFDHYESIHDVKGFVTCCDTKLIERQMIILHMARHLQPGAFELPSKSTERTNHKCKVCNKEFAYLRSFDKHKIIHHSVVKHTCHHCNIGFENKNLLRTHMETHKPAGSNKHLCEKCKLVFKNKFTLQKHFKLHAKENVNCSHCSFTCLNKRQLSSHVRSKHPNVKPHICNSCGKQFKMRSYLRKHLVRLSCS